MGEKLSRHLNVYQLDRKLPYRFRAHKDKQGIQPSIETEIRCQGRKYDVTENRLLEKEGDDHQHHKHCD
jgi:hypothetical protein